MRMAQKFALVTGASSGLGAEYARALAKRGASLGLTARRKDKLDALAKELQDSYETEVLVFPADLSDPTAPKMLFDQITSAGKTVDVLINNAGYGLPGYFVETSWEDQDSFLRLMLSSYAELVHRFLPGMIDRKFGRIINVSSVAGLVPGSAGHTMYGGVKSFLVSFSQSLSAETSGTGVLVSACCPGFTYTEFHDQNNTRHMVSKLPSYMWSSAEDVVDGSLKAIEKDKTVYVPGKWNTFIDMTIRRLPRAFAEQYVAKQSARFRAKQGPGSE